MLEDKQIIANFYGKKADGTGHKAISESGLKRQKDEDDINRSFYAGDVAAYTIDMSAENKKFAICFNRVRPYVHSFAGFAAQNRRTPEFFAIDEDDQKRVMYTETANKMLSWMRSTANADQTETAQDKELAICGYGVVTAEEDYMRNPDGEVTFTECTRDYWWDPASCQPGLSDRRWEYIKKKIHIDVALKTFGGTEDDYESADGPSSNYGPYEYNPDGGSYDKIAFDWVGVHETGMVYIYGYRWYDIEPYWRMKNPLFNEEYQADGRAGHILRSLVAMKAARLEEEESEDLFTFDPRAQWLVMDKQQYEDVKAILDGLGVEYDCDENLRKVYNEAILSGDKVFKKRKSVDQSGFAAKVKTADYYHESKIWFGMVSSLRDPAKFANQAVTKFLLILASTSGPGYFYNLNMVNNVAEFEAKATKNAKAIPINGDPNIAVKDKQQAALPNGYDALYPVFLKALSDVIGFAPEAMGMGDVSQPSFELEEQRIRMVMTTMAIYFDAITQYQKDHARSMLYFMRRLARNNEGRPIPMIDENGDRGIAKVYSDMIADEYAIDIGEAPETPTKKREQSTILLSFADKVAMVAPQKALEIYALASNSLPISTSDKKKWRDVLNPPPTPEAQAQAQKAQAMQEAHAHADLDKKVSEVDKNKATTKKTEAEAAQKDIENLIISTHQPTDVSVSI